MNEKTKKTDRTLVLTFLALALLGTAILITSRHAAANADSFTGDQWEYLAVAGPSTTNFSPTGNSRMRKEPSASFGREAFVLQQHLDRLGTNGWELVTVAGPPTDPAYYFKRRKMSQERTPQ